MGSELEAGHDETSQTQEAVWDVKANSAMHTTLHISVSSILKHLILWLLHLGNSVWWNSSWMPKTRENSPITEIALSDWKQREESIQGVSLIEGQARYLSCQALNICCFQLKKKNSLKARYLHLPWWHCKERKVAFHPHLHYCMRKMKTGTCIMKWEGQINSIDSICSP